MGVVATQLMDASPEVGVGEMSTGETLQGSAPQTGDSWKTTIFILGGYVFIHGWFSIVMVGFERGV